MIELRARNATFRKSGSLRYVLGRRPRSVNFTFGWEPLGHANPKDYAMAVNMLIALGLTSRQIELAKQGRTVDEILDHEVEFEEKANAKGIDPARFQSSVSLQNQGNNEVANAK